eukprot:1142480-Pelagomonas_calceolata.AAC.1
MPVPPSTQVYDIEEKDPNPPPPPEEGEEAGEAPPPVIVQVPELAVLKHRIDMINDSTGVMPVGVCVNWRTFHAHRYGAF